MNAALTSSDPVIAAPMEGGYYAGRIRIDGREYALIVAPKAEGEHADIAWSRSFKSVDGALSYCDGLANTQAMAEAGSPLAKWALGAKIGGYTDWYLGALDESEICYRALKPGTRPNYCWARSGINLHAVPPAYPYTPDDPKQTAIELFRTGAPEAFSEVAYWTSTQHASDSDGARSQDFLNGYQHTWRKTVTLRARLVRRLPI